MSLLLLKGNEIDGSEVSCRGSQLAAIIKAIADHLDIYTWVAFDVTVTTPMDSGLIATNGGIVIGPTAVLIEEVRKVSQFTSGVFIALPGEVGNVDLEADIDTEGPRKMFFDMSIIEIRAFDTSYFEIYTNHPSTLTTLRDCFGGMLVIEEG